MGFEPGSLRFITRRFTTWATDSYESQSTWLSAWSCFRGNHCLSFRRNNIFLELTVSWFHSNEEGAENNNNDNSNDNNYDNYINNDDNGDDNNDDNDDNNNVDTMTTTAMTTTATMIVNNARSNK